ncbi:glycosyltransferase [Microbacterium proteolyticum]|uniref:glycosyltransferase n=1 Tax=Microbacterium proteolyticum TaxID=1572644 RepID=UPI001FAB53AB|nr:glycosyltransferase [Microbacterium proteolyticum]MCI9857109.1 glycosyltransferase [Microbacterium proteolyticum]
MVGSSDEPGRASAAAWSDGLVTQGVAVETVSLGQLPGSGRARVAALSARIDVEGVSAVVGSGTLSNLAAIAARELTSRRPAVVATEHELLTPRRRSADPVTRLAVARARREYRRADIVTGSSHALAAEINAGFAVPASRSLIVPEPALAGVRRSKSRLEHEGAASAELHVVIAGELIEANGPLHVVAAVGELIRRGVNVRMSTQAGGPLREAVLAAARTHGLAVGTLSAGVLPAGSIVVLGASHSGLGGDLVRAAAAGVPAVAVSTALGVADAVIPGITGELAVSGDPSALADAIQAASLLDVGGVDEWLDRFDVASSTALLTRAINLAVRRNEATRVASA